MILELLLGAWAFNSISKDVCECIETYDEEQKEMQTQFNELQAELDELKQNNKHAPKDFISDGTTWNLNLKFSDDSYIYYKGYEEYPKNFDKLEKYLQGLVKNKNKEGNNERL